MSLNYIQPMFNYFDSDSDGKLTVREFKHLLSIINVPCPKDITNDITNDILYSFENVCTHIELNYVFDYSMFINKKNI